MSSTRTVARNVIANWLGMAAHMVAGFVVAPFLVRHLGDREYGWWILIGSLTGYFNLLDLGVSAAVGRNMAYYRAKGDRAGVNAVFNTSLALLGGVAGVALVGTLCLLPFFPQWFQVPDDQAPEVRLALLLFGVNLALVFPSNALMGTLWSLQRFDVLNAIEIPVLVLRVGVTFYFIGQGHGLVALSVIVLSTTLLSALVRAACCFRLDPGLRLGGGQVERGMARKLGGYGFWYFFLSMERPAGQLVVPPLIGYWLGPVMTTLHSFPARLTGYASSVMTSGSQVLTPIATAMHAERRHTEQQELVIEGSKYCFALGLYFICLFLWLGQPLLNLWVPGSLLQSAGLLLAILALGDLLPMSQWINYGIILGKGRHKVMSLISIAELAATVGLAWMLSQRYGLVGVCVAVAVPGALCRGVCQAVYCCRVVGVSLSEYVARAFVPPLVSAAVPAASLALVVSEWHTPDTWLQLCLYGAVFSVAYLLVGALVLLGPTRLRLWGLSLRSRFTGASKGSPEPALAVERNGRAFEDYDYPAPLTRADD
jgi:O-antigen/teichoic acid export membrane protein